MKLVLTEQMRSIEDTAINKFSIPSIILMENAAINVANECFKHLKKFKNPRVIVLVGSGNNGGDGLAVARHLHNKEVNTIVLFVGNENNISKDCKINFEINKNIGVNIIDINKHNDLLFWENEIQQSHLVVDAMIGTGLKRELKESYKQIIDIVNKYSNYTISVDCPTGIDSDSGKINGNAIKADKTVTFHLPKLGLYTYPAYEFCGEIVIADIGIPYNICNETHLKYNTLCDSEIQNILPKRKSRSNKGTYGKAFVIAGSKQMSGACVLASSSAYKVGAGLVNSCIVNDITSIVHNLIPEAVTTIVPDLNGQFCIESFNYIKDFINSFHAILLGPGIGQGEETTKFVHNIIKTVTVPIIIDADGINAISKNASILNDLKSDCLITPHVGEMSRLTGLSINEILDNTIDVALNFSKKWNISVLLKDSRTIIANPSGEIYINTTGGPAMSKAGTGDCLSGVILGLVSQGLSVYKAAALGAYINGKAGNLASKSLSEYGVIARDILNCIPLILNNYKNQ